MQYLYHPKRESLSKTLEQLSEKDSLSHEMPYNSINLVGVIERDNPNTSRAFFLS